MRCAACPDPARDGANYCVDCWARIRSLCRPEPRRLNLWPLLGLALGVASAALVFAVLYYLAAAVAFVAVLGGF